MVGLGDRRSAGAYDLGIDLGTTYTAAAVRRVGSPEATVVPLGPGSDQAPSVILLDTDGVLLIGDEAEEQASTSPERVVREYKRRLGDDTPMVVAGTSFLADAVAAETIRWAVGRVVQHMGRAPRRVAVTHPAGWGAYRRRLFADALEEVDLTDVVLLTEPEAAAVAYGAEGRVPEGQTVAVYDLGGGTFDAAVVEGRAGASDGPGVTVLGQAQGLDALGGVDFDEAVFWHVCAELGGTVAALDPADLETHRAVARLRRACVRAKEALSSDTEAVVDVELPSLTTRVRVTRSEFEEMIEPAVWQTVDVLREVLDGVLGDVEVDRVLLVGGSSRIPLVSRVLAREFGCPVALDTEPTTVVARGAALAAERGSGADHLTPRTTTTPRPPTDDGPTGSTGVIPTPPEDRGRGDALATVALDAGREPERPAVVRSRPDARPPSRPGDPDRSTEPAPPAGPVRQRSGGVLTAPAPAAPASPRWDDPTAHGVPARPPVHLDQPEPAPPRRGGRIALVVVGAVLVLGGLVVATTVPIIPTEPEPPAPTQTVPILPALPGAPPAAAPGVGR